MTQHRLFIGIPLSSVLTSRLTREISAWPENIFLKTHPTNLHVTIFFLGFIPESMVPDICEKIRMFCEKIDSFELTFSNIELMPEAENPKTAQLSGEPSEELRNLNTALKRELSFVVNADSKVYRPHITLARVKKSAFRKQEVKPVITKKLHLVETVQSVVVYDSIMEDGKRVYSPLESVPLM